MRQINVSGCLSRKSCKALTALQLWLAQSLLPNRLCFAATGPRLGCWHKAEYRPLVSEAGKLEGDGIPEGGGGREEDAEGVGADCGSLKFEGASAGLAFITRLRASLGVIRLPRMSGVDRIGIGCPQPMDIISNASWWHSQLR